MTRPTAEILVILFGVTICAVLLVTVVTLLTVEVVNPGANVSDAVRAVTDMVNTMLGLVVGFLAGRAGRPTQQGH